MYGKYRIYYNANYNSTLNLKCRPTGQNRIKNGLTLKLNTVLDLEEIIR